MTWTCEDRHTSLFLVFVVFCVPADLVAPVVAQLADLLCHSISVGPNLRSFPAVCRQCIVSMVHGMLCPLAAGYAATPPRCQGSRLKKSGASPACVTKGVSPSSSSSGASMPAKSDSGTPHPKRRRVTGKQSAHAAWQKPLALPAQSPVVGPHLSEAGRTKYQRW